MSVGLEHILIPNEGRYTVGYRATPLETGLLLANFCSERNVQKPPSKF